MPGTEWVGAARVMRRGWDAASTLETMGARHNSGSQRRYFWAVCGLILALLSTACGQDLTTQPQDVAAPEAVAGSSTEVSAPVARPDIEVVDDSIVRIVGFGCGAPALGSGFAVDTNLVVTSGHIVTGRDPESLSIRRPDGTEHHAVLVGFDLDLDLAVLRVDDVEFTPVNLVTEVPVVDGVAIGMRSSAGEDFVNEVEFVVDAPVNVNWDGVFRDTESRFRGLRIDAEVRPGDSGSGLFVNDRDVIGLIHSRNRNGAPRAYAVGGVEIAGFVDSVDPEQEVVAERCA